MTVVCPYCNRPREVTGVPPGRYALSCGQCGKSFQLTVTSDAEPAYLAAAIAAPAAAAAAVLENAEFSVAPMATVVAEVPADVAEVPAVLGGYQILKELGRGGMGAVYLARQVSLDRPVALKVMRPRWAKKPGFLTRFTREAFAAAQLVHHNIVQVYDIGAEGGVHYFSMEYVDGPSLAALVKAEGPLQPEVAAGHVLQAARGLKYAHDRGMIHRDVKPDNLLLNSQGVVKVADLGLVRTPGPDEEAPAAIPLGGAAALSGLSNVTQARHTMGTPAYMAPEQARDAAQVDHRADVYSLGCTLYVLLTGRAPFGGTNALEVITRHANEPVLRPERLSKAVPAPLSDIILKMMAKQPQDRHASMDEVIASLEHFLGLHGQAKAAEVERHVRTLEQGVRAFEAAPAAQLRSRVLLGALTGWAVLLGLTLLIGWWRVAGAVFGFGAMTALAYFVVHGVARRSYLFGRARDLLLSSTWVDGLKLAGGALALGVVLWLVGLLGVWALSAALGLGLALAMHFTLDRQAAEQRAAALAHVERLLKALRLRGLSEEGLREFVAKHAGERWEEVFEALFGYEAKLAARQAYGVGPRGPRPTFAAWRDPIVRWIDARQRARQEARARRHLQAVEQQGLEAQGVAAPAAKEKAEAVAEAMVEQAAEVKQEAPLVAAAPAGPPRRVVVSDVYDTAPPEPRRGRRSNVLADVRDRLLGGGVRLLLGVALVGVSLYWLHVSGLLPGGKDYDEAARFRQLWAKAQEKEPLPLAVGARELSSLNALAAGVVLILSATWLSWKIGSLVLLGAAVMVVGPHVSGLPPVEGLTPQLLCLAVGGAVALLGFLFGRDT